MQKEKIRSIESFGIKECKEKKALLVSNGSVKDFAYLSNLLNKNFGFGPDDFVIAADGGAGNCINLKIAPDVIIGDMDSLTANIVSRLNTGSKELKFVSCNHDKDESDTQLALDYLKNKGYKRVLMLGALGNRFDHSFANAMLLASESYEDMDIRIIAEGSEIFTVGSSCIINGIAGKKISIFSLTPYTYFEKTSGLKYPLKNEKLFFSPVRGLSNEFLKDSAKLVFTDGKLLIVKEI